MFLRICLCLFLIFPTTLLAERVRAVLVGVSDYAHLDADLAGPFNDVGLMARTLMVRGVAAADITVLAEDGADVPEGAARGAPDRAPILAALSGAIEASAAGDSVIFYFSGHGAQAPDTNGDEGGGLDEIFLPRDTKGWNGGVGLVENAIIDDELAQITEAAAARGVRLIGIIDACHSGTGFRAIAETPDAQARFISPLTLGLPDAVEATTTAAPPPPGEYVFLYAAQSDERAFEYPVGEDRVWHGDFTRALTTVMLEVPDLTWASLVETAQAQMRQTGGEAAQTPDIEGPLTDAPVLGGDAPGMTRIPVERQTLKAGLVRGLTQGSTLAVFGEDGTQVGQAVIEEVKALSARIRYLDPAPMSRVVAAEVTQRALDTSVRVAVAPEAAQRLEALGGVTAVAAFLDTALDDPAPTHTVIWTGADYALVGPDGILDAAGPGTSLRLGTGETAEALGTVLRRAVGRLRAEAALAQMAQAGGGGFSLAGLGPSGPEVTFTRMPGRMRTGGRCGPPPRSGEAATGAFAHCDVLRVTYRNTAGKMQDVTILYIDAEHRIETLWPRRGISNRIAPDDRLTEAFRITGSDVVQREVILVVSVPAEPGSMRTRLAFIGGDAAPSGAAGTYLAGISDPAASRSLSLSPSGVSLDVQRLELNISPIPTGE